MSGAHYQINQAANSVPTGTQDVARLDIYQSQIVHFVGDSSGGQASPHWIILAWPDGSARLQPTNATTFDASYMPDVPGSYRVEFHVDNALGPNIKTFIFAVTRTSAGIIIDDGFREPAFGEVIGDDNAGGNDRGYAKAYESAAKKGSITLATIATLRTTVASRFTRCRVLDYAASGDGGGGEFKWRSGIPPTDDGGINIVPTGYTAGWWQRQFDGPVRVEWFGGLPLGKFPLNGKLYIDAGHTTEAVDDGPKWRAAKEYIRLNGGGQVAAAAGMWYFRDPITVARSNYLGSALASVRTFVPLCDNLVISGQGPATVLFVRAGNVTVASGGYACIFGTLDDPANRSASTVKHVTIRDLAFDHNSAFNQFENLAYGGVTFPGAAAVAIQSGDDIEIRNVTFLNQNGSQGLLFGQASDPTLTTNVRVIGCTWIHCNDDPNAGDSNRCFAGVTGFTFRGNSGSTAPNSTNWPNGGGPGTFLEYHGFKGTITDNRSDRMQRFANLAGDQADYGEIELANNVGTMMLQGITYYQGFGHGGRDIHQHHNTWTIRQGGMGGESGIDVAPNAGIGWPDGKGFARCRIDHDNISFVFGTPTVSKSHGMILEGNTGDPAWGEGGWTIEACEISGFGTYGIRYNCTTLPTNTGQTRTITFSRTNGTAATIGSFASSQVILTGLAGMTAAMVGSAISISGCATSTNNGIFQIAAFISATSVRIVNVNAVVPDANNGSIVWSVTSFVDTATPLVNSNCGTLTTTGTLPAELSLNTRYYVVNKTTDGGQFTLTPDGTPIVLSGVGSGTITFHQTNGNHLKHLRIRENKIRNCGTVGVYMSGFSNESAPVLLHHRNHDHDVADDAASPTLQYGVLVAAFTNTTAFLDGTKAPQATIAAVKLDTTTFPSAGQFHLFPEFWDVLGPSAPTRGQLDLKTNGMTRRSWLGYDVDNVTDFFDAEFTGSVVKATATSSAAITKQLAGGTPVLVFQGKTGVSIGDTISLIPLTTIRLSNGSLSVGAGNQAATEMLEVEGRMQLKQMTAPANPPSGYVKIYFDGSNVMHFLFSDGTNRTVNVT